MLVKRQESLSHMLREFYETSPSGCVRCLLLGRGPRAFARGLYASPPSLAAAYLSRSCWALRSLDLDVGPPVFARGVNASPLDAAYLSRSLCALFSRDRRLVSVAAGSTDAEAEVEVDALADLGDAAAPRS